jgi:hypothetical protein
MERRYLNNHGKKPSPVCASCAKCGHMLVNEPPFNKDAARENKALGKKWEEDVRKVHEYNSANCNTRFEWMPRASLSPQ